MKTLEDVLADHIETYGYEQEHLPTLIAALEEWFADSGIMEHRESFLNGVKAILCAEDGLTQDELLEAGLQSARVEIE